MNNTEDVQRKKQQARSTAFLARAEMNPALCEKAGKRLVAHAHQAGLLTSSPTVSAFISMGTEISTLPLLAALLEAQRKILVPRLGKGREVLWSTLPDLDSIQDMGAKRPKEPSNQALSPESLHAAGVVFVPALAVDHDGNRLGRGAAWYDEALAFRSEHALTVAICWPWEFSETAVPTQPHDVPMDAVLTPEAFTLLAS
ncbi:MAG: 5-formyltetrahydrofolate cyclo-ligase [Bifidobacterium psychraerophilum]|uniref:5-formyltetrahydrofolate cyclo-ligase n=1 Tax=Bifidobacterium psychraerophilum TaxID=218140 RepID=UPI0039EAFC19